MNEEPSALKKSGAAADETFSSAPPDQAARGCEETTWVDIELVDAKGDPIPFQKFRLTLPDGKVIEDELDEDGLGGVEGVRPGEGKLEFPNLDKDSTGIDKG